MSIRHSTSLPPLGREAVALHIAERSPAGMPPGSGGSVVGNLQVTDGYPVFTVSLESLAEGHLFSRAIRHSSRYLVFDGTRPIAEAEIGGDERSTPRVVAMHSAAHAEATARGIELAEQLGPVRSTNFELAVIEVPGVQFTALWLRRQNADLLVPTATDMSSLVHGQAYREADAMPTLSARARHVREMQASAPGPSGA